LAVFYIFVAESDIMDQLFPNMRYRFLIITPQHIAIPTSLYVNKLLQKFSLTKKIYIFISLSFVSFCMIPIIATFLSGTYTGFYMILGVAYVVYTVSNIAQSNLLATASLYPPKFTLLYFFNQPVFNLFLMLLKLGLISFGISMRSTMIFVWGLYVLVCIMIIGSLLIVSNTEHFKTQINQHTIQNITGKSEEKNIDYIGTLRLIKWEVFQVFLQMFILYTVFPGVIYAPSPHLTITREKFLAYCNLSASIFGIASRPLASSRFNKLSTKINFGLVFVASCFLFTAYFTELYDRYEGIVFTYVVLVGLYMWCTGNGISYFNFCARSKANDSNRQAIGALMTNGLFTGVAFGNILSLSLPYIQSILQG